MTVSASADGTVATVLLDRAERANALDAEVTADLRAALRALRDREEVGCVVLTGAGRSFSAGGDVQTILDMRADPAFRRDVLEAHGQLFWELVRHPVPVVAALNGGAVGAGCTIALLCDLVVAADDAWVSDPRVALGLLDGAGGLAVWPLLTSLSAAREHLLLGDRVPAAEAHRLGLVNRVVPSDQLLGEVGALAVRLAALPRGAVQAVRSLLTEHLERAASGLHRSSQAEIACFDSDEHAERVASLVARGPREAS